MNVPLVTVTKTRPVNPLEARSIIESFIADAANDGALELNLTNRERQGAIPDDIIDKLNTIQAAIDDEDAWRKQLDSSSVSAKASTKRGSDEVQTSRKKAKASLKDDAVVLASTIPVESVESSEKKKTKKKKA